MELHPGFRRLPVERDDFDIFMKQDSRISLLSRNRTGSMETVHSAAEIVHPFTIRIHRSITETSWQR